MREEILADADAVARRAAEVIAEEAREAVRVRGRFVLATSGGSTPWLMLRYLADLDVPWDNVALFQVDERVAPDGDPDRNLTQLRHSFLDHLHQPLGSLHPMPVTLPDLHEAALHYSDTVFMMAGLPATFDLIHLGLGEDGHTASLVPGDPILDEDGADVGVSGAYAGRQRMTLTYPVLNRARRILWVVTGASKARMLDRLRGGDRSIPASRVNAQHALLLADRAASPHSPN